MADNNPNSRPRSAVAAPEIKETASPRSTNSAAGWFSITSLAMGVVYTLFLFQDSLQRNAAKPWRPESVKITMDSMGMFFLPLWCIIAVASGILGRRSAPGKVGIIASLTILLAAGIVAVWARLRYGADVW